MKRRLFAFFSAAALSVSLAAAAAPDDQSVYDDLRGIVDSLIGQDESEDEESDDTVTYQESVTNNLIVVPDSSPRYELSDVYDVFYSALIEAETQKIDEYSEISDISISPLYNLDNGSTVIPSTSLRAVLTNIIGPYSPVVVQYQYTNGTNTQYLREIMPDYVWMFSAALFAMVLWCVFRLWGSILCNQ